MNEKEYLRRAGGDGHVYDAVAYVHGREADSGATKGFKKDLGKPRMDLLPPEALLAAARVFTFGAEKYDPRREDGAPDDRVFMNNWREGMRWGRVKAALDRHMAAFWSGEDLDPETGEHHLAHALCNLMMLHEYATHTRHLRHDDRPLQWRSECRVALDIDGVLADWAGAICERARKRSVEGFPKSGEDVHFWNFFDRERWSALFASNEEYEAFLTELPALLDARSLPFEPVAYVTHRSVPSEVTRQWLARNGFPWAKLITVDKSEDKAAVLDALGVDLFVDDKFSTFRACNQAGILCFLMDRPYNRKWDVGPYRITSLSEIG